MEDFGRLIFLLLRNLFTSWLTHAPVKVQRIGLLSLAAFLLSLLLWGVWHLICRGIVYYVELVSNVDVTLDSFRIVIPQVFKIPLLVCMFGLFLAAVGHFPYDVYVLLRVAVFATCAMEFVFFREKRRTTLSGAFLLIGLLYNPLLPIHLHRSTWVIINWATLLIFGAVLGLIRSEGPVPQLIDAPKANVDPGNRKPQG